MHIALIGHPEDPELKRLQEGMEADAHLCSWAGIDADPAQLLASIRPDAIVVDLSRRETPPESVAALVAAAHLDSYFPVLGLLARQQVTSLDPSLGLDDFLVWPAPKEELLARVNQVLWRHRGASGEDAIRLGDLLIYQSRYEVWVAGREVTLTFKEYELLRLLASNPGRVFTRDLLLNRIWGYDYFGGTRTVDVHIRRLRAKLEDPAHTFIETVRNVGYRLKTD